MANRPSFPSRRVEATMCMYRFQLELMNMNGPSLAYKNKILCSRRYEYYYITYIINNIIFY